MEHAASSPPGTSRVRGDLALIAGIGLLGVLMAHWPMISSGFQRLQTDLSDSRLIEYLLEHGYLWLQGGAGAPRFLEPSVLLPGEGRIAVHRPAGQREPAVLALPRRWGDADLAFGLWMVTMSALNYAAGALLFRKGLGLDPLPAAAGAFLVAFGAPRLNQMGHPQLLPCFLCAPGRSCPGPALQRSSPGPLRDGRTGSWRLWGASCSSTPGSTWRGFSWSARGSRRRWHSPCGHVEGR